MTCVPYGPYPHVMGLFMLKAHLGDLGFFNVSSAEGDFFVGCPPLSEGKHGFGIRCD